MHKLAYKVEQHTNATQQAYAHIKARIAQGENFYTTSLHNKLPFIPMKIIHQMHSHHQRVQTSSRIHVHLSHPSPTTTPDYHEILSLSLFTLNKCHISSSLPYIHDLLLTPHYASQVIVVQETNVLKNKSTTYIDRRFLYYKITDNEPLGAKGPPLVGEEVWKEAHMNIFFMIKKKK
jgi:hypothetical protein